MVAKVTWILCKVRLFCGEYFYVFSSFPLRHGEYSCYEFYSVGETYAHQCHQGSKAEELWLNMLMSNAAEQSESPPNPASVITTNAFQFRERMAYTLQGMSELKGSRMVLALLSSYILKINLGVDVNILLKWRLPFSDSRDLNKRLSPLFSLLFSSSSYFSLPFSPQLYFMLLLSFILILYLLFFSFIRFSSSYFPFSSSAFTLILPLRLLLFLLLLLFISPTYYSSLFRPFCLCFSFTSLY